MREWHSVTVASMDWSICATGMPTMLLRPSTTTSLPLISTWLGGTARGETFGLGSKVRASRLGLGVQGSGYGSGSGHGSD